MQPIPLLCLGLIALLPAVLPSNTEPGLPAPRNVRINSYNMKHIMRWDPVEVKDEPMPVMYSVEFVMDDNITRMAEQNHTYFGRYIEVRALCVNITETECNFTDKILHIHRGKPMVRAELGSRTSDWVVMPNFQPSKNTTIGPVKSLDLRPNSDKLIVDFLPPFSPIPSIWTMKYNLSYWKENSEENETVQLDSATTYVLDNLEANTNYCVQVYAYTHYIKGLPSDPVCDTTVTDNTLIVVLGCVFGFILIFGVIALLIIPERPLHVTQSRIKKWLDGPYRIPSDILEYLEDPPQSDSVECSQNTMEEKYDQVSLVQMDPGQDVNVETRPDHSQPASGKT